MLHRWLPPAQGPLKNLSLIVYSHYRCYQHHYLIWTYCYLLSYFVYHDLVWVGLANPWRVFLCLSGGWTDLPMSNPRHGRLCPCQRDMEDFAADKADSGLLPPASQWVWPAQEGEEPWTSRTLISHNEARVVMQTQCDFVVFTHRDVRLLDPEIAPSSYAGDRELTGRSVSKDNVRTDRREQGHRTDRREQGLLTLLKTYIYICNIYIYVDILSTGHGWGTFREWVPPHDWQLVPLRVDSGGTVGFFEVANPDQLCIPEVLGIMGDLNSHQRHMWATTPPATLT